MKKTLVLLVVLTLIFSGIATILSNIAIAATPLVIEFKNGTVNEKGIVTVTVNNETYEMRIGSGTEGSVPLEVDGNQLIVRNNKELEINVENISDYYIYLSEGDDQKVKTKINEQDVEFNQGKVYLKSRTDGKPMSVQLEAKTTTPPGPEGPNPPVTEEFYGTVFFAWNDSNNVCVAEIDNLEPGGMNYIKESEVIDFIGSDRKVLDISKLDISKTSKDYYWLWDSSQLIIQDEDITKDWSTFRDFIEKNIREYAIDPCGSINGNNTITTNGDRVFRATIYSDKFEGLTFGVTKDDYKYFPDFWDPVFFSSTIDISNTTKENPAVYETYLLEPTIKFSTSDNSKSPIKSIKALDVNNNAVVIANKGNGNFEITFKSNFYDKVIFELTAEDGNVYYVRIARTVLEDHDNFGPDISKADEKITASLYYSAEHDYNDFKVLANINYSDGTKVTKILSASKIINDEGRELGYETEGGKELKFTNFVVKVDKEIDTIDYTVIYDGALDGDTYSGTFAGSGKGATYDVEEREIIYE